TMRRKRSQTARLRSKPPRRIGQRYNKLWAPDFRLRAAGFRPQAWSLKPGAWSLEPRGAKVWSMRAPILFGALLTAAIGTLLSAQAPAPASPVVFTKDVQLLLESTCLSCHGESVQLSKLDLRTRESALKGGSHGPAIVPGNAEQS